jgi:hypothetical protein
MEITQELLGIDESVSVRLFGVADILRTCALGFVLVKESLISWVRRRAGTPVIQIYQYSLTRGFES